MDSQIAAMPLRTVAPLRGRPRIAGKHLILDGEPFWVKGVTYGSFAPNDEGEPFPPLAQVRDDFAFMRETGINSVRLYTPPSDRIADAAADAGLFLIPDICWGPRKCELDDVSRMRFIEHWVTDHARRLADHPAVLMYSIGNEIPPLLVRWYGRRRIEQFLLWLFELSKSAAPDVPVTYANHPPTEHLSLSFLDVVAYNVYLEREPEFRQYLARLQMLAGDRPLFLAEIGMDSTRNGCDAQADFLEWQLRAVAEKGLCGAAIYSWTDEWAIHGQAIEGWSFGLTDADRRPKPALDAVQKVFTGERYELYAREWPRVSVVVAAYNAARTLDECLQSLEQLDYPDFEVIVVDDGSSDATAQIAACHPVRLINAPRGGLSRARNLGIEAATGEIVAFIDSDAYAGPDWLFYLVTTLEEHCSAGVGGPNLSPPQDSFLAQCIDCAPGNPIHVLTHNELAEHVPGCNMAFRKDKLAEIGNFDDRHRAAGDDVDVCWKLLIRRESIAFSPGAAVWHHRRSSWRGFWKQQAGYGYAEAHLAQRYPARFNCFGDLVWAGRIYDGTQSSLHRDGIPSLFRPRIYQGRFGSAQFQSIYQPFLTWWFQIFTTAEWDLALICVLMVAVLAWPASSIFFPVAAGLFVTMLAATVCAAAIPARLAAGSKRWRGSDAWKGGVLVALLHVMQPLARTVGRLRGWWAQTQAPERFPAEVRLYGNLELRETWLVTLQEQLQSCGWVTAECHAWGDDDIEVLGPGPYVARLCSLYEEDLEHGRYYIRYRIRTTGRAILPLIVFGLSAAAVVCLSLPVLWPLAIPVFVGMYVVFGARRALTRAVSQLAVDCGEAVGMTRVEEPQP